MNFFIQIFLLTLLTLQLSADGLTGKYYANNNFTDLKETRVDSTINFEWGGGTPYSSMGNDNYSISWSGYIYIPENITIRDLRRRVEGCSRRIIIILIRIKTTEDLMRF